jgi:ABC-2 type transport system permease protein
VSLAIIVRKEVRELMTPQTMLPVVAMSILFGAMGGFMGDIEEQVAARPLVGLVDQDASELSAVAVGEVAYRSDLVYNGTSEEEALTAAEDTGAVAVIVIPDGFQARIMNNTTGVIKITWYMQGAGILDSISTSMVEGVLWHVDTAISADMVSHGSDLNVTTVLFPTGRDETTIFKGEVLEGVSPETVTQMAMSQSIMVPMLIMFLFIMAGQTIIASMSLEKENKTLETLLTMPVKRTSIVAGKIVGAAVVGFIMAGIFMIGFFFYNANLTMGAPDDIDLDLSLSTLDYALVAVSMFAALMAGLALAMLLGTFAKDFKSGQTLIFPLVLMALIPMFLTMFKDFDTLPTGLKVFVFLIPFSHPMMAMRSLMFGDYVLVVAGIAYSIAFAVVVILILVRIFATDKLLTGRISSKRQGSKGGRGPLRFLGR